MIVYIHRQARIKIFLVDRTWRASSSSFPALGSSRPYMPFFRENVHDLWRCFLPTFWRPFRRSPWQALLHLFLAISWLELLRLLSFYMDHRDEFGLITAGPMGRSSLASFPKDLVLRINHQQPLLAVNSDVPTHIMLPAWIPTALSLLLARVGAAAKSHVVAQRSGARILLAGLGAVRRLLRLLRVLLFVGQ